MGKTAMKNPMCLVLVTALLLSGCVTGFKAESDFDPSHDFNKYQSFAWISDNPMKVGEGVTIANPLLEPRIMAAMETALTAKGYRKAAYRKDADFVVSFTIGARDKIRVDSYPSMSLGYSAGYPSHWRWGAAYHCCANETRVREYTTGVLAMDVFDVKEKRPVWHGVASKSITQADRKNVEQTVNAAVAAIMTGFPPQ